MKARALRAARWTVRLVVGLGLLLIVTAAGLWWWAGQEGSLEWLLRRVSGGPLQTEGVEGSIRHGWKIRRIVWERDGLRLEAEDIRLEWQPLALLEKTLHLDEVQVARARVIDRRPASASPLQPPTDLRLPWRVTVEDLQVRELAWDGRFQLQASGLAARYAFDGLHHRVELKSLRIAGGEYSGEGQMLALAPLTLDAKLAGRFQAPVPGRSERVPIEFTLQAQGPAARIAARAQLQVLQPGSAAAALPHATATARITPFAEMPVPQGEADFRQLDAALFWPQAPRTRLSGHVEIAPQPDASWSLRGEVRNALPGPWDAGRLPIESLRAEGDWRGGMALVRSLHARSGGGTVTGEGSWKERGWHFAGRVDGVDPSQLHRQLAPLPLTGPLELEGEQEAIGFVLALKAGAARAPARREKGASAGVLAAAGALELRDVSAQGRWAGDALSLSMLRVRTADATLDGKLELQLAQAAGSGQLELQAPGLRATARGSLSATRGQGSADVAANDLALAQRWLARWPGLADTLKGLALRGNAQARLAWQGGWRDPALQGRVRAQSLAWQPPAGPDATPPWLLREATLSVQGRLRDAALALDAQARQGQRSFELAAAGQLSGMLGAAPSWRGQVASLLLTVQDPALTRDAWRLQLQRPVEWRVQGDSFTLSAGEALLRAPAMRSGAPATDAVLTWTPVRHERGQLATSGRLAGLPMAWIELFGGPQLAGSALSGDMVFDAQWNAVLGQTPRIEATLARVRGDVNVLAESVDGAAARVTAGVREARVRLTTEGEQVVLSLLWDSERAGHAEGEIRSRLERSADGGWEWPAQAPLAGRVQAQLPRIGVWSLLAPPGWRLRGSLTADIAVAGTRALPQLAGPVQADDLALRSVVDGIELRNGRLRAQLAGQKLTVSEFLLRGSEEGGAGGGSLLAYGEGAWTAEGPVFEAHAQLSQLRASIRSDRQLTVSGPVEARMDRGGTSITGQLRVDRARIQIPDETPPRLGEDVVVRNAPGVAATEAERRVRPAPSESAGRTVTMKLSFDLGSDFRVSGRGVDTRLVGSVDITGASAGLPQIAGLIRTAGGTYEAYGQRMNIEKGELRFTGAPDNPALDILAIRPNLTPKVGVQVTGRAQSPHVELYSEAGLSEAETLSYLVLGQSSAGGGAETALLQRAAAALLAGRGGTGKGIAGKLGLDDLTVRSEGSAGAVVRLGKRFADNFYAAYERSLAGAAGTLFIFYDLSQRVTVRAEAGERSGLDLIFTFSFDGFRRR